jgi:2-C-methyl-D-erythritol 4-phosphate cytidylyltransferase
VRGDGLELDVSADPAHSSPDAAALIVAAGSGTRLGARRPKAFVELAGKTLLDWSVAALRSAPSIGQIVVALPGGEAAPDGTTGVRGGAVRSASVSNALAAARDVEFVLVHDAARPLLTSQLVERVLRTLRDGNLDAAIAATRVTDTIKREAAVGAAEGGAVLGGAVVGGTAVVGGAAEGGTVLGGAVVSGTAVVGGAVEGAAVIRGAVVGGAGAAGAAVDGTLALVAETVTRSGLWAVQTPQAFRRDALQRALAVEADVLAQATDDAWLIERAGGTVALVASDAENLKITTPLDLELAALLLRRREIAGPASD